MGKPVTKPGLDPRMTSPSARLTLQPTRGSVSSFPKEEVFLYDDKGRIVSLNADANAYNLMEGDLNSVSKSALYKQYTILNSRIIFRNYETTANLLKACLAYNQLLLLYLNIPGDPYAEHMASYLIEFYEIIESRTKSTYSYDIGSLNPEKKIYTPLPIGVLQEFPLNNVDDWRWLVANFKRVKSGKIDTGSQLEINDITSNALDENVIPELELKLDELTKVEIQYHRSNTPLITRTIRDLKKTTVNALLSNIEIQRKQQNKSDSIFEKKVREMKFTHGKSSLHELTGFIMYHSVYTVLLDPNGNPSMYDPYGHPICQSAESPILYATYKIPLHLKRSLPPSDGSTYLSLGRYAGWGFKINDKTVKQLYNQLVGGFYFSQYAQTGSHPFQDDIQQWIIGNSTRIIAAVTSPSAFNSRDISAGRMIETIPVLVDTAIPFVYDDLLTKIKDSATKEYLVSVGKEIILEALKSFAIEKFTTYLIKKIGKKIVPLINLAFTVVDLFTSDEENRRARTIIACIRLSAAGETEEDYVIAGKVLSKILIEIFEDELIEKLGNIASNGAGAVLDASSRGQSPPTSQPAPPSTPAPSPTVAPPAPVVDIKPTSPAAISPPLTSPAHRALTDVTDMRRAFELSKARLADTDKAELEHSPSPHLPEHSEVKPASFEPAHADRVSADKPVDVASDSKTKSETSTPPASHRPAATHTPDHTERSTGDTLKDATTLPSTTTVSAVTAAKPRHILESRPGSFVIAGIRGIHSWSKTVLIGTSRRSMRRGATKILLENPNHPLRFLLKGRSIKATGEKGIDAAVWDADIKYTDMGHARSGKVKSADGGKEYIVLMSTKHNRQQSADYEQSSTDGAITHDFAYNIDGIAVHSGTVRAYVDAGLLDRKYLADEYKIDLSTLLDP